MKELNGGKQMTSVWQIPLCTGSERLKDENGKKAHSTQKPEELLKRIILSSSKERLAKIDPNDYKHATKRTKKFKLIHSPSS